MEFENFPGNFGLARDLFYLASILTGAAAGCILNRFRRNARAAFRSRTIAAAMFFLSGAVTVIAAVFILSRETVFYNRNFCIPGAIFLFIAALVFRFPRAAGFPVIAAALIIAVWVGVSFLRYPVLDSNQAALKEILAGKAEGKNGAVDFSLDKINAVYYFPLVGGETRANVTEIGKDGEVFFKAAPRGNIFPWCFRVEEMRGSVEL